MLLKNLIQEAGVIKSVGDLNLDITNIHSDSRKIKEGGLFFAINGFSKNGIEFIENAIEKGAKAIIVEKDKRQMEEMAQTQNYQGVIAIVPPFEYCEIEDILNTYEYENIPKIVDEHITDVGSGKRNVYTILLKK